MFFDGGVIDRQGVIGKNEFSDCILEFLEHR